MTKIYYQSSATAGVNITFNSSNGNQHDYFSSMWTFRMWANSEFRRYELIEVTTANYQQLVEQGAL